MKEGRLRARWVAAVLLATALAVSGLAMVATGNGRVVANLLDGGAWLANSSARSVSHAGPAGVDANVGVRGAGAGLKVVQSGANVYVRDDRGDLARIDPAQLDVSEEVSLPPSTSQVVAGGGRLWGIDPRAGTVQQLNPIELHPVGPPMHLPGPLGTAVADPAGTLWVPLAGRGSVVNVNGQGVTKQHKLGGSGQTLLLSVVDSGVVAVDPETSTLWPLTGPGAGHAEHVPVSPNAGILLPDQVQGSTFLPIVDPATDEAAALQVGGAAQVQVHLGRPADKLGAPQVNAGRIYIPDYSTGALLQVDLATDRQLPPAVQIGQPGQFSLVANDGELFVNQDNGNKAWVIAPSGTVTPMTKYDPRRPGGPPPSVPAPPKTSPTTVSPPPTVSPTPTVSPAAQATPPSIDTANSPGPSPLARSGPGGDRTAVSVPVPVDQPAPSGSDTPSNVVATAADHTATVTWAAPAENKQVAGYQVVVNPLDRQARVGPAQHSFTDGSLTNGQPYTFTVAAIFADGGTGPSATSNTVTPEAAVAGPPGNVVAAAGDGAAMVGWSAPALHGGVLAGYRVAAYPQNSSLPPIVVEIADPSQTTTTVSGLVDGVTYLFAVAAQERDGTTGHAGVSMPVTPVGLPGAPTSVTATPAGSGEVLVSWRPAPDNGLPISHYQITSPNHPTVTVEGTATQGTVTGLDNGTSYTFAVAATNAKGTGPAAPAGQPAVPQSGVPDAPTGLQATPADGSATLTWQAPSGNGTTVNGYTLTDTTTGATTQATATTATVGGLADGTTYTFTVSATGADGATSPPTQPVGVTPAGPPAAPAITATPAGSGVIQVAITPGDPRGSTISGYTVTDTTTGATTQTTAATTTFTGLNGGETYAFTAVAVSNLGNSPPSNTATAVPVAVPGPVQNLQASDDGVYDYVTWDPPANAGTSPITSYTVTATGNGPDGVPVTTSWSGPLPTLDMPAEVPVVTTSDTITVTAVNAVGPGTPTSTQAQYQPPPPPPPNNGGPGW